MMNFKNVRLGLCHPFTKYTTSINSEGKLQKTGVISPAGQIFIIVTTIVVLIIFFPLAIPYFYFTSFLAKKLIQDTLILTSEEKPSYTSRKPRKPRKPGKPKDNTYNFLMDYDWFYQQMKPIKPLLKNFFNGKLNLDDLKHPIFDIKIITIDLENTQESFPEEVFEISILFKIQLDKVFIIDKNNNPVRSFDKQILIGLDSELFTTLIVKLVNRQGLKPFIPFHPSYSFLEKSSEEKNKYNTESTEVQILKLRIPKPVDVSPNLKI